VNFSSTGSSGHFSDGGGPVPANKNGGLLPARRLPY
jgi:hypothetical protein